MSEKEIPKVGDTMTHPACASSTISSVDAEGERFWCNNDTLSYFFEDVVKDTEKPNTWILIWD